jgi:hypothetical protein
MNAGQSLFNQGMSDKHVRAARLAQRVGAIDFVNFAVNLKDRT